MKRWPWTLLGKGPEVAVVTFCTGDAASCRPMARTTAAAITPLFACAILRVVRTNQ